MLLYYETMEKLRLKEEGEDSLHSYLMNAGYNLTHLARRLNRTTQGFLKFLKGGTNRYDESMLEQLAKEVKMVVGRDSDGVYFYNMEEGRMLNDLDSETQAFIEELEKEDPEFRKEFMKAIYAMLNATRKK